MTTIDTYTVGLVSITPAQSTDLQEFFTGISRKHEDTVWEENMDHTDLWTKINDHILDSILDGDYAKDLQEIGLPERDEDSDQDLNELIMNNLAIGVTKHMGPPPWLDEQGNPRKQVL